MFILTFCFANEMSGAFYIKSCFCYCIMPSLRSDSSAHLCCCDWLHRLHVRCEWEMLVVTCGSVVIWLPHVLDVTTVLRVNCVILLNYPLQWSGHNQHSSFTVIFDNIYMHDKRFFCNKNPLINKACLTFWAIIGFHIFKVSGEEIGLTGKKTKLKGYLIGKQSHFKTK